MHNNDLPAVVQHMNLLFDFYGSLLTDKQAACFTMRYVHDYSLTEIAQELGSTPQAIVDFIKRAIGSLERYEKHLGLVTKFQKQQPLVDKISNNIIELECSRNLSKSEMKAVTRIGSAARELEALFD